MKTFCLLLSALLLFACGSHQGNSDTFPQVEAIDQAMLAFVDSGYIPGAVTAVVTREKILHLGAVGVADY